MKRTIHFRVVYEGEGEKKSVSRDETGCDAAANRFATVLSLGEKDQTPSGAHPNTNATFVLFGVVLVEK